MPGVPSSSYGNQSAKYPMGRGGGGGGGKKNIFHWRGGGGSVDAARPQVLERGRKPRVGVGGGRGRVCWGGGGGGRNGGILAFYTCSRSSQSLILPRLRFSKRVEKLVLAERTRASEPDLGSNLRPIIYWLCVTLGSCFNVF